jgi:hypothetical protein
LHPSLPRPLAPQPEVMAAGWVCRRHLSAQAFWSDSSAPVSLLARSRCLARLLQRRWPKVELRVSGENSWMSLNLTSGYVVGSWSRSYVQRLKCVWQLTQWV